jgi:hypothetical protein
MRFAATAAVALLAGGCSLTSADRAGRNGGHPPATDREIDRLITNMRHDVTSFKLNYTTSVSLLIKVGKPAVPKLVALMEEAEDEVSRIRAQTALNGIVLEQFGFRFGQGWVEADREEEVNRLLATLGRLDRGVPAEERRAAAQRWREWAAGPVDDQE